MEIPGHGQALLAAYPEHSCRGGPFKVWTTWGIQHDLYCVGNDDTLHFLEELITELVEVFNESRYIHIGGDEAPKTRWKACPKCQARLAAEQLDDYDHLQYWLMSRFAELLRGLNRTAMQWDDIWESGVPENAVVMSWIKSGSAIANAGHYVVQAPYNILYFPQKQFTAFDGYQYPGYLHTLKTAYRYDPEGGVDEAHKKYVLGAEAPIWTEHIWNITDFDWKLFPRGIALAELTWTNMDRKFWPRFLSMLARAKIADSRLNGINSAPLTITPAGDWFKGEIPSDHWVSVQWPVKGNFEEAGSLEAAFIWKGGRNGLRVRNVKLIVDGEVMYEDAHECVAYDTMTWDPIYNLKTTRNINAAKVVVVYAEIQGDGGSDTEGSMYCYSV